MSSSRTSQKHWKKQEWSACRNSSFLKLTAPDISWSGSFCMVWSVTYPDKTRMLGYSFAWDQSPGWHPKMLIPHTSYSIGHVIFHIFWCTLHTKRESFCFSDSKKSNLGGVVWNKRFVAAVLVRHPCSGPQKPPKMTESYPMLAADFPIFARQSHTVHWPMGNTACV